MADLAIGLPQAEAETAVFVAFAFMIGGILVKAAVFPVHIWLPAAYGYAPSAVSTLLAAVATRRQSMFCPGAFHCFCRV